MADSQILRWIDDLNGITDGDLKAKEVRREIRRLHKEPDNIKARNEIKKLYKELDSLQFKPDYMHLIIDKPKDYYRACKGFQVNGVNYVRLLGTNGGIKNSTIVFVSERLAEELRARIENGRDQSMPLVTAKLEAYKALVCSASNPVSMPNGVLVVDDAKTEFLADYTFLTNEGSEEPVMKEMKQEPFSVDASDGFGMMLPALAERWSKELGLGYTSSGFNTRMAFTKGMVFAFDFVDFAEKVAGTYYVRDAWGKEVDVRTVELVLTTSMVKLYDSYKSCEDFISKSLNNDYSFAITKNCPEELETEHCLNYQFIQSFNLTDDDIDELIEPTAQEIEDVIHCDWRKAVLFLKGVGLTENNVASIPNDYVKAMMVDHRIFDDPYVQNNIYQQIRNRIDRAKIGIIKVHGNYSIASGDPYLLCQSMFGLEKTGLLKAGEIYNQYWADHHAESLVCFRAPMSTHSNIRKVHPVDNDEVRYWYRHIHTATLFNGWDTAMAALNGMDYDGDLVMLTDNDVLVRNHRELPAIMCEQQKAAKRISVEDDFVKANIASFGNEIGQITNWITSMYEVQSVFPKDSLEYKTLEYRIMSGQLIQQQSIDKAKGIIARPMPRSWHDRHAVIKIDDEQKKQLYKNIVADKKPYFMRYIYPEIKKEYNTFIKKTSRAASREFGLSIDSLIKTPKDELTERQAEFLKYYWIQMPLGVNDCVMNKICRKFEERFDGIMSGTSNKEYDYSFMKDDSEYNRNQYNAIKKLYEQYNRRLKSFKVFENIERMDSFDALKSLSDIQESFERDCSAICSNRHALCNIILDICYTRKSTKTFAWHICSNEIIENLLANNNNTISFPMLNEDGDVSYAGKKFEINIINIGGGLEDDYTE